jgi:hypothetical protein
VVMTTTRTKDLIVEAIERDSSALVIIRVDSLIA